FSAQAAVQPSAAEEYVPKARLILRLQDDATVQPAAVSTAAPVDARLAAVLADLHIDGVVFERVLGGDILVARMAPGTTAEQARAISELLNTHPAIRYAEPDGRVRPAYVPADPLRVGQWFQYEAYGVSAYDAWDVERGAAGVVMALLDSGIRTHEDLDATRVLPGYDFVSNPAYANDGGGLDANPTDPGDGVAANECGAGEPAEDSSWHGLHLAGIMIAQTDNNIGVAGLNHVSKLLPVRVLGKCGGSYADIIAGILWAAGLPGSGAATLNPRPAHVINLSFAAEQACTAGIQDAIDRAVAAGAVVVAAAGNSNGLDVANVLPAGCSNVIAVAATTRGGDIAGYSNVGSRVSLSAPGGDGIVPGDGILSLFNSGLTTPGADDYAYFAGTSVAAAQVAAGVSLLISIQPGLTSSDVRTILRQSASAFPAGGCPAANCGAGILNLDAAVRIARSFTPSSASTGDGGGGGGGCVLRTGADGNAGAQDVVWLLVLLGVAALRRAGHGPMV
ncbi:MAG TPA: S8 family serine peptidase, partial [Gammaproteobacteria bacterium]